MPDTSENPTLIVEPTAWSKVRSILPALVALLITTAMFLAAVFGLFTPDAMEFQHRAASAIQAGHFKEAVIWLRREIAADPTALPARMQLTEVFASLDQPQAMVDLLNQIAPGDRVVYGPAHLYRAQRIMETAAATPQARAMAKSCIELALKADPSKGQGVTDKRSASVLLVEILIADGDWKRALAVGKEIPSPSPVTRLQIATALKNLGQRREAMIAADAVGRAVLASPEGASMEERLSWASTLAQVSLLKDERDAAVSGVLAAGDGPGFQALQTSVCHQAARAWRGDDAPDSGRWLECMLRGLVVAPDDPDLTTELLTGTGLWIFQPGFTERCFRRLAESGLNAHLQLLSAISSLRENRPGPAFDQFEAAWKLSPGNPIIANNYAVLLGVRPLNGNPAAALAIIDGVLGKYPENPSFLDSRGQILLRLGRTDEAVQALESALKIAPSAATHLALAEAYSRNKQMDLAASHRKAALPKLRD